VRSGPGKTAKNQKKKRKKKYSGQQQKEIDCDEPHPAPNEKAQPIQWTERPTGALVAVNSLWPIICPLNNQGCCTLLTTLAVSHPLLATP
jgi:hypothetical protein